VPLDPEELQEAEEHFQRWSEHNPIWTDSKAAFIAAWDIVSQPVDHPGTTTTPQDRVTRLCDIAAKAIRNAKEGGKGIKLILMVQDDHDAGIEVSGYRDSEDALVDLLVHVKGLLKAHEIDVNAVFRALIGETQPMPPGLQKGAQWSARRSTRNNSAGRTTGTA